jgi:hypothetical protein
MTVPLVSFSHDKNDVQGTWLSVVKEGKLAKQYMSHTFSGDSELLVQTKEDIKDVRKWKYIDGKYEVDFKMGKYSHKASYKLTSRDTLVQLYKSGKVRNNYVRLGSTLEKSREKTSVFERSRESKKFLANYIDHTSLEVGKTYKTSRRTPLMKGYTLNGMLSMPVSSIFRVLGKRKIKGNVWYQVEYKRRKGFLNSIALIGQSLKP